MRAVLVILIADNHLCDSPSEKQLQGAVAETQEIRSSIATPNCRTALVCELLPLALVTKQLWLSSRQHIPNCAKRKTKREG